MDLSKQRNRLAQSLANYQTGGIRDQRVLEAMRKVPRHLFLKPSLQSEAYEDQALPISCGQTISQPYIVGLMTEWLELRPDDRILEIGTGSGYQSAVLAEIVSAVYTIEFHQSLHNTARGLLESLGYENIRYRCGDGYHGWSDEAPFDNIIVTCRVKSIPPQLEAQLKIGGRLVIPIGGEPCQTLYAYKKNENGLEALNELPVRFVPLLRN